MKIAVKVWFEFDRRYVNQELIELDFSPHFMEWDYPVLPRTGEYICNPAQFLSEREKGLFKNITLKEFYKDFKPHIHINSANDTLFDFYNDPNGDRFLIKDIEWVYDKKEGHYPIINIFQQ